MIHFVRYDLITGLFKGAGSCGDDQFSSQASAGIGVVESAGDPLVASEVDGLTVMTVDLTPVRSFLMSKVDAAAGASYSAFYAAEPGLAEMYALKAIEAKAWTAGAPDVNSPYMAEEAISTGKTVAEVCASILAKLAVGAKINGRRIAAKQAIGAAATIKDMVEAATVDWDALTSGSQA